ncbi:LOW QUALITY PROTEIN: hypothetical protein PHMEG_00020478 [Phytophthora megakarya]|uniref:Uncharacterized protein n=1 Tax=Phytophthora megakarya TaxID=4795 RepID=A0A225VPX8_9STRA|nr:LOW QUALITY PROTEIN: hypothetical protein PHMEG_00020478 [Phytophthora megakarya]
MPGRGPPVDVEGRQRMKLRCKLLLANVPPEILKVDLKRLVDLTHREAKMNDLVLHDSMIERATRQQQYHLMQADMKQNANPRSKVTTTAATKSTQRPSKLRPQYLSAQGGDRSASSPSHRAMAAGSARVPIGLGFCPTSTVEQKAEVAKTLRERRGRQTERVKHITVDDEPTFWNTTINGVLDVPFCPDTGSNANLIGRPVLDELCDLTLGLPIDWV